MMKWGKLLSTERLKYVKQNQHGEDSFTFYSEAPDPYRTAHYRDGDRILFSSAFRRMHDKTQVYPLPENDHVHSRLTHSIEVASIGRGLGYYVGCRIKEKIGDNYKDEQIDSDTIKELSTIIADTVYAACLAHDIGNPPFGHSGEKAIGSFFKSLFLRKPDIILQPQEREELVDFEGNAQGFRVITHAHDSEIGGMRLTAATIAAFCKYPRLAGHDISKSHADNVATSKFCCFMNDKIQLNLIADKVGLIPLCTEGKSVYARHPLAFLVEAADNISYLILDLEDGIRLGYVDQEAAIKQLCDVAQLQYSEGMKKRLPEIRGRAIDKLRQEVSQVFLDLDNYNAIMKGEYKHELTKNIHSKDKLAQIREFTKKHCYEHRYVDEMAISGSTILNGLLEEFIAAVTCEPTMTKSKREMLLRLAGIELESSATQYQKILMVTDYISGMTDGFASRLFKKIRGIDVSSDIR